MAILSIKQPYWQVQIIIFRSSAIKKITLWPPISVKENMVTMFFFSKSVTSGKKQQIVVIFAVTILIESNQLE